MRTVAVSIVFSVLFALPTMACVPKVFALYFVADSSALRDGQEQELAGLVATGRKDELARLFLIGSAARSFGEEGYVNLSQSRLDVIEDHLVQAGVPADRMQARVAGDEASRTHSGPVFLNDPVLSNYVEAVAIFRASDGSVVDGCGRKIVGNGW